MPKTRKHRKRTRGPDLYQQAERNLERRDFKQALKDARVLYRQYPATEHRQLLERALLARGEDLHRSGLRDQCRAVLSELVALKATVPEVKERLPEVLLKAGLLDARTGGADESLPPEDQARLMIAAADHAVAQGGEAAPPSFRGIQAGAAAIRSALGALEAGDEAAAHLALREIPRQSPFADWKLFVRGLAAWRRQDAESMAANWGRLDPGRPAARLARALEALADPSCPADPDFFQAVRLLEAGVPGVRVLMRLRELKKAMAADDWPRLMDCLRRSGEVIRRFDPALSRRLTQMLISLVVRRGDRELMRQLMRVVEPLPIDPRWNRALARVAEEDDDSEFPTIERHWRRYLHDLEGVSSLTPDERRLAQALVWQRLGDHYVTGSMVVEQEISEELPEEAAEIQDELVGLRARAVDAFEQSLQLAPRLVDSYRCLISAHRLWRDEGSAVAAALRLLDHFPEDLDTLLFLADHHLHADEPLQAREYARRAHRLKPLDPQINGRVWSSEVASARHLALKGAWDEARQAFHAAEKYGSESHRHAWLVRRAVFELKAGNADLGDRLVEEALGLWAEPTAALLLLTTESSRYRLPKAVTKRFEKDWKAALKRKTSGQAAGVMCEQLHAYLVAGVDYPGRANHVASLTAYVRRCTRTRFQPDDLRHVCEFLDAVREQDLRLTFLRKGAKLFPDSPWFLYMVADTEIDKGPFRCNRRLAHSYLERALDLAEGAEGFEEKELLDQIRRRLAFLDAAPPVPFSAFFGAGPGERSKRPQSPAESVLDAMAGLFDKLGIEHPEDLDDFFSEDGPEEDRSPGRGRRRKR